MEKKPKILTPANFAKKNKLSRVTVWRWITDKRLEKRLKMYDAKKIEIDGKSFIEVAWGHTFATTTKPLDIQQVISFLVRSANVRGWIYIT